MQKTYTTSQLNGIARPVNDPLTVSTFIPKHTKDNGEVKYKMNCPHNLRKAVFACSTCGQHVDINSDDIYYSYDGEQKHGS